MGAAVPSLKQGRLDVLAFVLEHRAVLTRSDGTPFSALVETYTREVLAFPAPSITTQDTPLVSPALTAPMLPAP